MVGQFGHWGDPKDRVKRTKGERLSDLASTYTVSAINTIAGIMENPEAKHADRLAAARMLLDRAVGLPVAAVEVSSHLSVSLVELLAGLPGGQRPATIEHDAPPPRLVGGISLMEAAEAAAELSGQVDGEGAGTGDEEEELVLQPANDDGTPTQPGGE